MPRTRIASESLIPVAVIDPLWTVLLKWERKKSREQAVLDRRNS